jgi:aspartyl aminopeptidase
MYHAIENLQAQFAAAGYTKLSEKEDWALVPGGRYCLSRGGSAFVAFQIPAAPAGFAVAAAHSDRPCLKVKEDLFSGGDYTRLSVETYGGLIMSTWLDRPLSIVGRVFVETESGVESRLVNIDRDIALIPNVAIHMNREANSGYKWNPAVDLLPLLGGKDCGEELKAQLEEIAGGKILGHDLYLYVREDARVWGLRNEYLSAPALDDLACVWGCAQGLLKAEAGKALPVLCVFDSEEVGSSSNQGADSTFLDRLLVRISAGLGLCHDEMLHKSFLLSADNAHAIHPNHPEYADSANAPVMGGGIVLKFNANLSYTTDGYSAAVVRKLCKDADVAVQTYYNRADLRGGSTLGHISTGHVSVPSADIGLAQLAMHSCYETLGVEDVAALEKLMQTFFAGYTADMVR